MKKILAILFLITSFCAYSQKIKSIVTDEMTLTYDTLGHPMKMITIRHGETTTVNYRNKYDEQNRMISSETLIDSFPLLKTVNKYEANKLVRSDHYQRTKFGTIHQYAAIEYNKHDSVSRKIVYSHEGDTLEIIARFYDKEKKLVKETDRDLKYKILSQKEFKYSLKTKTEKELRTRMESRDTSEFKEVTVTFNAQGDIVRSENWSLMGSLIFIDDKEVSISKEEFRHGIKGYLQVSDFEYTYDKHNNWTQLDYYYLGKGKNKDKTSSKRTIKYY